jgi:ABC-2 type transport system ATP-binding protein
MTSIIEIAGLRKEYRLRHGKRVSAVDGLDLSVPEGGVFGFLGPNGSGKTTTIRCMLGLVSATSGTTAVLGRPTPADLSTVMPRVGSIVETPAMFPTMTARENLQLLGAVDGIGKRRVIESLEKVGLGDRADHKVRTYSLGMRQRLGLAAALLKDPALLVLDEPANGLDPAGTREIRELLHEARSDGPSRVTIEIEPYLDIVRLTVTQEDLADEAEHNEVAAGWSGVLSNLKTFIETGHALPQKP